MNVFIIKCGNEKMFETVSFRHALEYCREIDKMYGENSASIWKESTDSFGSTRVRMNAYTNVSIHDNIITNNEKG